MTFQKGHKINLGRRGWSKGLTKETDKRIRKASEKMKGRKPWCTGLTAKTDERIRKLCEKGSKTQREMHEQGKLKPSSGCFKKGIYNGYGFKKGHQTWNKLNLNAEEIIRLYKQENYSAKQIAKIFNCTPKVILRILKENKIDTSLSNLRKRLFKLGILKSPINGFKKKDKLLIERIKKRRAKQIFPKTDTSIEIKIQSFLKELGIEFFTHQYMNIEHSYQCDILIPSMNMVIETDGNYWHKYPIGTEIDHIRTSELIQKGFKVLRLWEKEIKIMDLNKFKEILNGNGG